MRTGLVSVTFRQLSPEQIIDWVNRAGLDGIEWGGDIHVPHGDLDVAQRVGRATRDAGLEVAAYGSYYKVGVSEDAGLPFDTVLSTAVELGAPSIRVWAGATSSADVDDTQFRHIVAETRHICDMAARHGLEVAFEFHANTLTDSGATARRLLEAANHSHLKTLWQPRLGIGLDEQIEELRLIASWLLNLHVFYWREEASGRRERLPLANGEAEWAEYLRVANELTSPNYALLEFLRDDAPEQLLEDAATLCAWREQTLSNDV